MKSSSAQPQWPHSPRSEHSRRAELSRQKSLTTNVGADSSAHEQRDAAMARWCSSSLLRHSAEHMAERRSVCSTGPKAPAREVLRYAMRDSHMVAITNVSWPSSDARNAAYSCRSHSRPSTSLRDELGAEFCGFALATTLHGSAARAAAAVLGISRALEHEKLEKSSSRAHAASLELPMVIIPNCPMARVVSGPTCLTDYQPHICHNCIFERKNTHIILAGRKKEKPRNMSVKAARAGGDTGRRIGRRFDLLAPEYEFLGADLLDGGILSAGRR